MHELDLEHQAIADTARARVMALFNQSRVFAAEVVIGELEDE